MSYISRDELKEVCRHWQIGLVEDRVFFDAVKRYSERNSSAVKTVNKGPVCKNCGLPRDSHTVRGRCANKMTIFNEGSDV